MKEHAMFALSVVAVFASVYAFQKHVYKLPVIGAYLPGGD